MSRRLTLTCVLCLAAALAPARAERAAGGGARQASAGGQQASAAAVRCDLWAYAVDPDPAGLNVRSGPGKQYPVVGTLPRVDNSLEVHVLGATGQWLRIGEAMTQETGESVFKGPGWVFGPMLAVETKDYASMNPNERRVRLFKEPSPRSAVVTRLPSEAEVNLVGCKGKWARVRHQKSEGWLAPDSQCHSTLTTCS
jgi:SH3-like domain-containing protein